MQSENVFGLHIFIPITGILQYHDFNQPLFYIAGIQFAQIFQYFYGNLFARRQNLRKFVL